jgi:predicted 3-demethylubiquinone-9 3-methyltransferase (glyoxalase superfamily)
MSATFELEGQKFIALNAGPQFKFTEAISFFVDCKTQAKVDEPWEQLSAEGREKPVRLAERQIRVVVADHPFYFRRPVAR